MVFELACCLACYRGRVCYRGRDLARVLLRSLGTEFYKGDSLEIAGYLGVNKGSADSAQLLLRSARIECIQISAVTLGWGKSSLSL